jgi:hypothetical protein
MFSDSANFGIVDDGPHQRVIHTRDLGPESSWADRVINGVDLDDTCKWSYESDLVRHEQDLSEKDDTYLMVGDKKIDRVIRESGNYHSQIKGTGESKTFYRKRKIPQGRVKNFPVKPHTGQQRDKVVSKGSKYDIVQGEDADYHTIRVSGDESMYACIEEKIIYGGSTQLDCPEDLYGDEYYEDDYPILPKSERAFVWVSQTEKYIARGNGSYDYEEVADIYYPPYDSEVGDRAVMWCPPEDWVKPVIYWDRIWSEMDYDRLGYRRAYTYTPQTDTTKARIQFFNHNL